VPSSRPDIIPTVIHLVRQLKVRSILDVGVGFGKWGHLFREYTDILEAENDPGRYEKANWRVKIDGIEGHAPYLTAMHHYLYDQIHVGDAAELIRTMPHYDLIFLGDIIEHFEKVAGVSLLRDAVARASKAVIVSTPKFETGQEALCGNQLEQHRSVWNATDFRRLGHAQVKTVAGDVLLAVFRSPGLPKLNLNPKRKFKDQELSVRARDLIRNLIPGDARFILVDEEQLRHASGFTNALPFLEKNGRYWGPPQDDQAAIEELERMKNDDSQFIVFISSTFWWLQYYRQFEQHLRSRYSCIREDEQLVVFDLRQHNSLSTSL
jgi:hypothetical protein